MLSHIGFTLVLLLATYVSLSEQLQCYVCEDGVSHLFSSSTSASSYSSSSSGGRAQGSIKCGIFSNSLLMSCSSSQACLTIKGESNGWVSKLHRCGSEQDCSSMDGRVEQGVTTTCTSCRTDGCNGAIDPPRQLTCYKCATELNDFSRSYGITNLCSGDSSAQETCSSSSEACYAITGSMNGKTTNAYTCGQSPTHCSNMNGQGNSGYSVTCKSCTGSKCNKPKIPGPTLQCYECESRTSSSRLVKGSRAFNSDCGEFRDNLLVDCSPSSDACVKVDKEIGGESVSSHSCGTKADCNFKGCYSCSDNKCNGAAGIAAYGAVTIAAIATVIIKMQ